jgi:MFS family permease
MSILVPTLAAVAYWCARSLTIACMAAGFAVAAAVGAWIGFSIQAFYYNDLEWRVLEEVMFFLLGGLGALAGRELGRWIAALRAGSLRQPSASEWRTLVAGVLLRIAIAAVGLWLGAEAGYWIALLWDEYASPAPFAYGEVALAWIVAGCAVGGALAVLGYREGHRAPVAAAFLGALLGFVVAPHLAPVQEHLYWGPFPSSDVHAELWRRSLLVTGMLAAGLGMLGYLLARWLRPRAEAAAV